MDECTGIRKEMFRHLFHHREVSLIEKSLLMGDEGIVGGNLMDLKTGYAKNNPLQSEYTADVPQNEPASMFRQKVFRLIRKGRLKL